MSLRVHWEHVKMHLAVRMAYRTDFFISFTAYFLFQMIAPLFTLLVYGAGGTFPGWTLPEMLLLQGTYALVQGFSFMLFFQILGTSNELVRQGRFDLVLLRPIPSLWYLVMSSFDTEDIGRFLAGTILTGVSCALLWPLAGSWPLYFALVLAGVIFFFALAIFATILTIRVIATSRLYELVEMIGLFGQFPKGIYARPLAVLLSALPPILVASFYPASALLGLDLSGAGLAVASALALFALSLILWKHTLRWYSSAGG